ncbi:MAG: carboxymuconolactone decarboxylase family protein [Lachnotalea sp.]
MKKVSQGFEILMKETEGIGPAFMDSILKLSEQSALDKKTYELAYISVLVTAKMYTGLPFHIQQATELGASKAEIKTAILIPMPIIGIQVTEALPYLSEIIDL